eukprot:163206-Chlamydomonas_euryale.AAC.10
MGYPLITRQGPNNPPDCRVCGLGLGTHPSIHTSVMTSLAAEFEVPCSVHVHTNARKWCTESESEPEPEPEP